MNNDPRKEKRAWRIMGYSDPVYEAWIAGQWAAEHRKPYSNPYPAGRRHEEFKRGYSCENIETDKH